MSTTPPAPATPARPASGKPSAEALARLDRHWRLRYLLLAPHRLGFFLAMVVLVAASLWWALVQVDQTSGVLGLSPALAPSQVHAVVMVFGFMPLFFAGFMFTACPKWLQVAPLPAKSLLAPLLLQALGWLVWLVGAQHHAALALAGAALAALGLAWTAALFWGLVRQSHADDQLHARAVGLACMAASAALAGTVLALAWQVPLLARACTLSGLWGGVVVVFVAVAHRMVPFFTSDVVPLVQVWRPFWVLGLMLAVAVFEAAAVWVDLAGPPQGGAALAWGLLRGAVELSAGAVLLWLAGVWRVLQKPKSRLLVMLHLGFAWLGVAVALGGATQLLALLRGAPALPLATLHALAMGCLASLMLAMVTRVSCGYAGRAQVADRTAWTLFWLLQAATVVRLLATWPSALSQGLLLLAALLWAGLMAVWGVRLGAWYGRVRADGRPG